MRKMIGYGRDHPDDDPERAQTLVFHDPCSGRAGRLRAHDWRDGRAAECEALEKL
jgi:hypothetical protein